MTVETFWPHVLETLCAMVAFVVLRRATGRTLRIARGTPGAIVAILRNCANPQIRAWWTPYRLARVGDIVAVSAIMTFALVCSAIGHREDAQAAGMVGLGYVFWSLWYRSTSGPGGARAPKIPAMRTVAPVLPVTKARASLDNPPRGTPSVPCGPSGTVNTPTIRTFVLKGNPELTITPQSNSREDSLRAAAIFMREPVEEVQFRVHGDCAENWKLIACRDSTVWASDGSDWILVDGTPPWLDGDWDVLTPIQLPPPPPTVESMRAPHREIVDFIPTPTPRLDQIYARVRDAKSAPTDGTFFACLAVVAIIGSGAIAAACGAFVPRLSQSPPAMCYTYYPPNGHNDEDPWAVHPCPSFYDELDASGNLRPVTSGQTPR